MWPKWIKCSDLNTAVCIENITNNGIANDYVQNIAANDGNQIHLTTEWNTPEAT